ncbi:uncharacterized protein LOC123701036 [Colias croceus]|uniref:uncharacterized protein LOC123701036 n=1 Tax=Colias crocea TaxID=72248 RepID=UPI001E27C21E|nr:uncharacterized protein LOC123701036 [Colias croceus]
MSFTGEQRAFCVRAYFQNNNSLIRVRRLYRLNYRLRHIDETPSNSTILSWIRSFNTTGNTTGSKKSGRPRSVRTVENIELVASSVQRQPQLSIRKRQSQLGMSRATVHRILRSDLNLKPYKIQIVQELRETDFDLRLNFVNTMLEKFDDYQNIFFSDEAHFHLDGYVNRQNCRFWGNTNPGLLHQRPLHSPKVTAWVAMSAKCVIGPYFFEDARGRTVTVNSARYVTMLRNFFEPELQECEHYNVQSWFQQDGATSHTTNNSIEALHQLFPEKVISRRGDIEWPPRSPDLTPPDFFLWGYLKSNVYENSPQTLNDLKTNIREKIASIDRPLLQKVFRNFHQRLEECQHRNGRHLNDVIFKK